MGGRERVDGGVVLRDIILDGVGVLEDAVRTVLLFVYVVSARKCQLCFTGTFALESCL